MRVLIIHRYFWPEDGAAEEPLMLKDYVEWHRSKGHDIELVFGAKKNHKKYWENKFDKNVKFNYFTANVDRESSFTQRILNSIKVLVLALKCTVFKKNFDLIYVFSGPPLISLIINLVNLIKINKSNVIFILQDNVIYRIKNSFLKFLFKKYLKYTVLFSKKVIVLSDPMKDEILNYFSKNKQNKIAKKIFVLVNFCFDLDYKKSQSNEGRKIDILYAGNHGPSQGLLNFLDVLSKVKCHRALNISFYGDGTQKTKIIQKSNELNLNIKFNDPVPRYKIKEVMSQSRFGLVSMNKSLSSYAFPSKLAAYLSSGAKVIISSNGKDPLKDYVKKYDFGFAIDSSKASDAAKSLEKNLELFKCNNFEFKKEVLKQFDKKTYFQTLDKILF